MTFDVRSDPRRRQHKCDVCGVVDFWGDSWVSYGSLLHAETCPHDLPAACSEDCAKELMENIESGEWELPLVRMRGYDSVVLAPRKGY